MFRIETIINGIEKRPENLTVGDFGLKLLNATAKFPNAALLNSLIRSICFPGLTWRFLNELFGMLVGIFGTSGILGTSGVGTFGISGLGSSGSRLVGILGASSSMLGTLIKI